GGDVVNASSEACRMAINGMSYRNRAGQNSNSAVVVTVNKNDFGDSYPLVGVDFQRELEERTYKLCEGRIPVQRFEDFKNNVESNRFGDIVPQTKGEYSVSNIRPIFPSEISHSIEEAVEAFGRKIKCFNNPDTVLSAIETRTSSPVRIIRDKEGISNIKGIYPCGEGAGYAGGITSAAIDGLKISELIAMKYYV
ncbi:MAG: NAD(P)/FAD-dependent oxidoreductase, partial [Suipraeoptans sp.]